MYDDILMTHGKWWVPAQWFGSVAARARREGRIKDDVLFKHLLDVSIIIKLHWLESSTA